MMATYYRIPIELKSVCLFPFITIHQQANFSHWNFWKAHSNRDIQRGYQKNCGGKSIDFSFGKILEPERSILSLSTLSIANGTQLPLHQQGEDSEENIDAMTVSLDELQKSLHSYDEAAESSISSEFLEE